MSFIHYLMKTDVYLLRTISMHKLAVHFETESFHSLQKFAFSLYHISRFSGLFLFHLRRANTNYLYLFYFIVQKCQTTNFV